MEAFLWLISQVENLAPLWSWLNRPFIEGLEIGDGIATPLGLISIAGISAVFGIKLVRFIIGLT